MNDDLYKIKRGKPENPETEYGSENPEKLRESRGK